MDLLRIPRQFVQVRSGTPVCGERGYCGPFVNEAYYAAFPEPLWHGMADCVECGTTCKVAPHLRKQRRAELRAA